MRAAYPGRTVVLDMIGQTQGYWDGLRLQRLLGNLVVNALKYGSTDSLVRVVVANDEDGLRFEVRNTGSESTKKDWSNSRED